MSGTSQIHIFFGAPILPAIVEKSREEKFSITAETWKQLHLSFAEQISYLDARKFRCCNHTKHIMLNNAANPKDLFTAKKCILSDVLLTGSAADVKSVKSFNEIKEKDSSAGSSCFSFRDRSIENHMNYLTCEQFPNELKIGEQQSRESEDTGREAKCLISHHLDFSPLAFVTCQANKPSDFQNDHPTLLSQHLEIFPQIMKESVIGKTGDVCSNAVSTETEFLSIQTASQVPLLSGRYAAVGQNEVQSKSSRKKMKLFESQRNKEATVDSFVPLKEINGVYADTNEINTKQNYESSLELFDSASPVKDNLLPEEIGFQDNVKIPTSFLHSSGVELNNALIYTEPLKKKILCFEGHSFAKRSQVFEDVLSTVNVAAENQQQAKKARLTSSLSPIALEQGSSGFKKVLKYSSLLKDCLCKNNKYTVLVTVLHPCHIKEIQIKPGTKLASNVPLATIVVLDQSEIQRKIVLWRAAAFWSLTVFPGDIILITDVITYENRWIGETMLQSTSTTQLLNFGSCSSINHNEFSHIVDVNILQDLLQYVSSKHACLQALPQKKTQTLNSVQHVLLDQLEPDMLVHLVVKIVDIAILTESTYSFKGKRQQKIILTVEQVKDQHYALVLWGAATAHCPHLQRKRVPTSQVNFPQTLADIPELASVAHFAAYVSNEHKWEFKYLLVKHSPVSGELELHTTPWSTLECLFNDDRRAVEFKEKFKRSAMPLISVTALATHLEEKCSGMIQVKVCISKLKFTIDASPHGQLVFDVNTSLQRIFTSLAPITFAGCAKCGLELQADDNNIYKQCISCLPSNTVKIFYRPSVMTVTDGGYEVCVQVVSELMEKIFLNIPAEWLNKTIEPSIDTIYGMIVADLCHSLLADRKASYLLTIRSHFVLDENSYPLEMDFHLVDFHLDL